MVVVDGVLLVTEAWFGATCISASISQLVRLVCMLPACCK